jgi:hypothetical protein
VEKPETVEDLVKRRGLSLCGVAGGILWITVVFFDPDDEILRNRLWSVALIGMFLGGCALTARLWPTLTKAARIAIAGFDVGLGLMTLGSAVEYWLLFRLPHQGGPGATARGVAWMTFLLGVLVMVVFATLAGIALLRDRSVPRWLGLLFLLLLPTTAGLAFVHRVGAAVPIACLCSVGIVLDRPAFDARTAGRRE